MLERVAMTQSREKVGKDTPTATWAELEPLDS